ncbi:HNH endonuclease [Ligilactobacillus cholophilus]|uniref:HNH endonuclease n=1 Tax=Ligilactobacillus cholophilus TaxID=3050131 RepID=UPI0025B03449|nr:HNH endonuclease [Ligilactobacillus cholophilus]
MAKYRECIKPTCHELIQIPNKYCEKHRQEIEQQRLEYNKIKQQQRYKMYNKHNRDKQANAFYQSKEWKATRNYVINRDNYVCCVCGEPLNNTKIIDHITPRRADKTKELDTDNLWCLCYKCHNIKTSIEEQIINSPNGKNKIKHINKKNWKKYILERLNKRSN